MNHKSIEAPMMLRWRWMVVGCWMMSLSAASISAQAAEAPDFAREVRPLLARYCFKCHGPDEQARKSGLRLDLAEAATEPADSGDIAIIPGQPQNSQLITRILSTDASEVMPPPSTKVQLTDAEKDILQRWIAAGAGYQPHWAYQVPKQAPLPAVKQTDWPRNPIDHFVLARLEALGWLPSPQADRYTLLRRLSLDLIGLPPTVEELEAFVKDPASDAAATEKVIDRLLASERYGERWARRWLDLARYADTNGYEKDRQRSIWPYREWVIRALNRDLPFDQFTIEQLAGDMLPNATREQRVATGFHRNTMLNEEGGIDPLEYRFHAMTDRVATTGTTWLGLTIGCAQCHTHKYDPITHTDYYRFYALLNNADEPDLDLPTPEITAQREAQAAKLAERLKRITTELPPQFPIEDKGWQTPSEITAKAEATDKVDVLSDGSIKLAIPAPDKDTVSITFTSTLPDVQWLRLETLPDDALPMKGPGRAPNGNFVVQEVEVTRQGPGESTPQPVKFQKAEADFSQNEFPAANLIDGKPDTGWAIWMTSGNSNVARTATLTLAEPWKAAGTTTWTVKLPQNYGGGHTLGRFRLSVGGPVDDPRPLEARRAERVQQRFSQWLTRVRRETQPWVTLVPKSATSNLPLLTVEPDGTVFVSGDMSKSDLYELQFTGAPPGITALRMDVLADDQLPAHGPGRVYYEGPKGDFFLSEFMLDVNGERQKFRSASHSFAAGNQTADRALDGDQQSGWAINGGQGRDHHAIFVLEKPLTTGDGLKLQLLFEKYFAAGVGKFRISALTEQEVAPARDLTPEVEALLRLPDVDLSAAQRDLLFREFLLQAPEFAKVKQEIEQLSRNVPAYPTTLVFDERPANNPRPTHRYHRGEYLQPREAVTPGTISFLPALPQNAPSNRLALARWLVSRENPLTARVTVNRQWAALFGQGLVRTTEDFGYQGELPSHPELLDWLAVEFMNQGWSLKKLHKLIVMSATYQQSSSGTVEAWSRDQENRWLSRGPRVRLEAEVLRDAILLESGLLANKIGGPSVFPPQPASVTTEGTYGGLVWNASQGPDRYRRTMYTFLKRTAPFAMLTTFDGPSGEACVARRDVSNTPLQALTLLNDQMFLEASQALGRKLIAHSGNHADRLRWLILTVLSRPARDEELPLLTEFLTTQRQHWTAHADEARKVAGIAEPAKDQTAPSKEQISEQAAWTTLARVLLNLDEAIVKQ